MTNPMSVIIERDDNESSHSEVQFDGIVSSAIETVFGREEETYSEMLGGFLVLNEAIEDQSNHLPNGDQDHTEEAYLEKAADNNSSDDSISEEEIGPGSSLPSNLFRTLSDDGGPVAKVDNFVDSDLSDASSLSDFSDNEMPNYIPTSSDDAQHIQEEEDRTQENLETIELKPIVDLHEDISVVNANDAGYQVIMLNQVKETDPLPGQLDDNLIEGEKDCQVHVTNLNTSTNVETCDEMALEERRNVEDEDNDIEDEDNEVNEFKLDDQFDYDRVTLTPRYIIPNM